jgi:hypothetical protein
MAQDIVALTELLGNGAADCQRWEISVIEPIAEKENACQIIEVSVG